MGLRTQKLDDACQQLVRKYEFLVSVADVLLKTQQSFTSQIVRFDLFCVVARQAKGQ